MNIKIKKIWNKLNFLRSLKARIFIIVFLTGIIPSIVLCYGILENYEDRAISLRTSDMQNQLNIIANHLITYNYLSDASSEVISAELEQLSNLYDGRVMIINSGLKVIKDTYGTSEGKTVITEAVIKCMKGGTGGSNYDYEYGYIEITTPIIETATAEMAVNNGTPAGMEKKKDIVRGVMLTSVSTESINTTLDILSRRALLLEMLMLLAIFAIALLLSNVLMKPFERVAKAISEVKEGYKDEPISVPDYLETEHIVDAFNQLQNRMRVLDFVANVSHELKTPITSVKVLADSLLAQEDVPAELYREFMVDIAEEIEREDKIINDLLSMVKMDRTVATMNISVVDVNALTEIILKRLRPIA